MKQLTNKKSHSTFGKWFFSQPKVVRIKMLQSFEAEGIRPETVRGWAYRKISPIPESLSAVEKITGQQAEILFPY